MTPLENDTYWTIKEKIAPWFTWETEWQNKADNPILKNKTFALMKR